jgi:predicted nucleic acid-binding protein
VIAIDAPLIADSSVLVKWFHTVGEDEVAAAEAVLRAHRAGQVNVKILDLVIYELGNILLRSLRWPAKEVADQLEDLLVMCGPVLMLEPAWRRDAAELAQLHRLTFYDAALAAAARGLDVPLISADRQLLASGLAQSLTSWASAH